MGPITANASQFLFNTDYPMDKVTYLNTGSFTMAGSSLSSFVITHGLPFTPLTSGSWSFTSDFATKYEFSSGTFTGDQSGITPYAQILTLSGIIIGALNAGATSTTITIGYSNTSASPITVYYRIYAFEPPNSSTDVPFTVASADAFQLSTDYNYRKLYIEQVQTVANSQTYTISHNLGYIPQVDLWTKSSGITSPYDFYNSNMPSSAVVTVCRITVTTSAVVITTGASNNVDTVYIRIYVDNAQ